MEARSNSISSDEGPSSPGAQVDDSDDTATSPRSGARPHSPDLTIRSSSPPAPSTVRFDTVDAASSSGSESVDNSRALVRYVDKSVRYQISDDDLSQQRPAGSRRQSVVQAVIGKRPHLRPRSRSSRGRLDTTLDVADDPLPTRDPDLPTRIWGRTFSSNSSRSQALGKADPLALALRQDGHYTHLYTLLRIRPLPIASINAYLDANAAIELNQTLKIYDKESSILISGCGLMLHEACRSQSRELVDDLLYRGAEPGLYCQEGHNALQCTANSGHLTKFILRLLMKDLKTDKARNDYINSLDKARALRATHYAVAANSRESVITLIRAGANWKLENGKGQTPFQMLMGLAKRSDIRTIARILVCAEFEPRRKAYFLREEGIDCETGCTLTIFNKQSTTFIQGYILGTLIPRLHPVVRSKVADYIGTKFRKSRKPDDPVGASGMEPGCFIQFKDINFDFTCVTIPYFSARSLGHVLARKDKYKNALDEFRFCKGGDYNSLGMQCTSTLDEYCNPSLDEKALNYRNRDQVIGRHQKTAHNNSTTILLVPQLWIWSVDEYVVVAGSGSEVLKWTDHADFEPISELSSAYSLSRYLPTLGSFAERQSMFSTLTTAVFISRCIAQFNRPHGWNLSESILSVFESSIHELAAEVRDYTKNEVLNDENMDKEKTFILQIGDIREELSMISRVLLEQEAVWRQFVKAKFPELQLQKDQQYIPDHHQGPVRRVLEILLKPEKFFYKYKEKIKKIDTDAQRVEDSIMLQLDLKSKHAGLKEAHLSTLMSASIIGFSVVTIIFTPLSFLASFFALSTTMAQRHQENSTLLNGPPVYRSRDIAKWMILIEFIALGVTTLAIYLALKFMTKFSMRRFLNDVAISIGREVASKATEVARLLEGWTDQLQQSTAPPPTIPKAPKPATQKPPDAEDQETPPETEKRPIWKSLNIRRRKGPLSNGELKV